MPLPKASKKRAFHLNARFFPQTLLCKTGRRRAFPGRKKGAHGKAPSASRGLLTEPGGLSAEKAGGIEHDAHGRRVVYKRPGDGIYHAEKREDYRREI